MSKHDTIEQFLYGEQETPVDDVFAKAIDPPRDFLPGALLVNNEAALHAAKQVVEEAIRELVPQVKIEWQGTIAIVRSKKGDILDRVEIHGASYDRQTDEATGVRFDLSGLRLGI